MTDRRRHLPKRGPNSGLALGFSSTGLLDHVLAGLEEGGEGRERAGFFFPSPRATALFCGRQAFGVCRFIAKFMCFPIDAVFTTCSVVFLEFPLVVAATGAPIHWTNERTRVTLHVSFGKKRRKQQGNNNKKSNTNKEDKHNRNTTS